MRRRARGAHGGRARRSPPASAGAATDGATRRSPALPPGRARPSRPTQPSSSADEGGRPAGGQGRRARRRAGQRQAGEAEEPRSRDGDSRRGHGTGRHRLGDSCGERGNRLRRVTPAPSRRARTRLKNPATARGHASPCGGAPQRGRRHRGHRRVGVPRDRPRGPVEQPPFLNSAVALRPRPAHAARRPLDVSAASAASGATESAGAPGDRPRRPVGDDVDEPGPSCTSAPARAPIRPAARRPRPRRRVPGQASVSSCARLDDEQPQKCRRRTLTPPPDQLDEFEAELLIEAQYTADLAVPYCAHAGREAYLQQARPQGRHRQLPVLPAQMEDVWVWDKNRPARPRAEVCPGDVTVRASGQGDERASQPRRSRAPARSPHGRRRRL